jgi:hypothetical protein
MARRSKGRAEMETPGVVGGFGCVAERLDSWRMEWMRAAGGRGELPSSQHQPNPPQEHGLTVAKSRHAHCPSGHSWSVRASSAAAGLLVHSRWGRLHQALRGCHQLCVQMETSKQGAWGAALIVDSPAPQLGQLDAYSTTAFSQSRPKFRGA